MREINACNKLQIKPRSKTLVFLLQECCKLHSYAFNGKEKDDDIKGSGNSYDYGMRIYDSRLGRFLSIDPIGIDYPWNSTYAFAENGPIENIDLDGLEKRRANISNINRCWDGRNHPPRQRPQTQMDIKRWVKSINRSIHKHHRTDDVVKTKKQNIELPNDNLNTGGKEKVNDVTEPVNDRNLRDGEVTVPSFFTSYATGDVYKDKNSTDFNDKVSAGDDLLNKVEETLKTFENPDEAEININVGGKDVSEEVKQKRGESIKKTLEENGFKGKINVNSTTDDVPVQIFGVDGDKKSTDKSKEDKPKEEK